MPLLNTGNNIIGLESFINRGHKFSSPKKRWQESRRITKEGIELDLIKTYYTHVLNSKAKAITDQEPKQTHDKRVN